MRSNLLGVLLAAAMLAVGCDSTPPAPKPFRVEGYIRNVAYGVNTSHHSFVAVETATATLYTIELDDEFPPVWTGLHGIFTWEASYSGRVKNFVVLKRLP